MPRTKRSQVRPPRKPRGESAKVTIANQDRQISLLVHRTTMLVAERDAAISDALALQDELTRAESKAASIVDAHQRLLGWQDCAREMLARTGIL